MSAVRYCWKCEYNSFHSQREFLTYNWMFHSRKHYIYFFDIGNIPQDYCLQRFWTKDMFKSDIEIMTIRSASLSLYVACQVCNFPLNIMFYPRAFCLLLDYLPILQHLPHELFGIWEQFVFSHLVICSKLFYPSMHALKCLAISTWIISHLDGT